MELRLLTRGQPVRRETDEGSTVVKPPRLVSLDVLRGLTVALMIAVNNAGDGRVSYRQLRHSVWNGCTLTDLVFPTFLFIVGASIALAFESRVARGASRGSLLGKVLKRAVLIALIGLFLNAYPHFHLGELRFFGVLQRIALCYALASLVYLFGGVRAAAVVAVAAIAGYWWLLTHVRVPGFGMPGVDVLLLDPHGNLAAWLDRTLVPPAHMYRHTFYDPEGLLGTISSLGETLIGVTVGAWLQTQRTIREKAVVLLGVGAMLAVTGLMWSHWLALNKRLWTSSFALYTTGVAMVSLAVILWLVDGPLQMRRGLMPWLAFGTNALTAYVFSEALQNTITAILTGEEDLQKRLYHLLPQFVSPSFTSMLYSILFVTVCFFPVYLLYRKKIFLKI
jgi:predicted acyltransferase